MYKISEIISIRDIIYINLQVHEGLPLVFACEAEVQFDIVRGINISLGQHLVVHIVTELAIQCVTNHLLSVPGQCRKVGTQLLRVGPHDCGNLILGQAELCCCLNKNQAIGGVPVLLRRDVLSVHDEARRSEGLAESEARIVESFCMDVSGFRGNQGCQVQLAHGDHTVGINPEALPVIPCL